MSSAIPFHFFISSYPDEKLIQLESEYFQKLEDFSKVFCDKLTDNSITEYDFPFYRDYCLNVFHELLAVRSVLFERNVILTTRNISEILIQVHDIAIKKGFNWKVA